MKTIKLLKYTLVIFLSLGIFSCTTKPKENKNTTTTEQLNHAASFQIEKRDGYTLITVTRPWPGATKSYTYALYPKGKTKPKGTFDAVIATPVEKIVVTSTTHIPALEALGVENTLIGFPDTKYISSPKTRARIDGGNVKELGINESINTEVIIDLNPEVIIGFAIDSKNETYATIEKAGIPVVYNGDWTEETPLGKAEWIKFFAPFFNKEATADSIFNTIANNYVEAKKIAATTTNQPTVLSGAMFRDIWNLPGGKSWMAQYIKDAHADYIWKDTQTTGSLTLNFETVYEKGADADFWIGPGQFTGYGQMTADNGAYADFKAFKNKSIFTFSKTVGATGGLLYYELEPSRPDLVLKDLIYYLHPGTLTNYEPFFFKPLD